MNSVSSQWVGIDVSKASLEVFVQPTGAAWQVANTPGQIEALGEQLAALGAGAHCARSQRWL